jgi:nicotinamidase-related amidase
MTTGLLVIDIQQGLCTGECPVADPQRVSERANTLSRQARAAGLPVIIVRHEEDAGDLVHGSAGWQMAKGVEVAAGDLRIRKRTPSSFEGTGLKALLDERGVTALVVCGMQSDFCVNATARAALALGYPVTLAADAHDDGQRRPPGRTDLRGDQRGAGRHGIARRPRAGIADACHRPRTAVPLIPQSGFARAPRKAQIA